MNDKRTAQGHNVLHGRFRVHCHQHYMETSPLFNRESPATMGSVRGNDTKLATHEKRNANMHHTDCTCGGGCECNCGSECEPLHERCKLPRPAWPISCFLPQTTTWKLPSFFLCQNPATMGSVCGRHTKLAMQKHPRRALMHHIECECKQRCTHRTT